MNNESLRVSIDLTFFPRDLSTVRLYPVKYSTLVTTQHFSSPGSDAHACTVLVRRFSWRNSHLSHEVLVYLTLVITDCTQQRVTHGSDRFLARFTLRASRDVTLHESVRCALWLVDSHSDAARDASCVKPGPTTLLLAVHDSDSRLCKLHQLFLYLPIHTS